VYWPPAPENMADNNVRHIHVSAQNANIWTAGVLIGTEPTLANNESFCCCQVIGRVASEPASTLKACLLWCRVVWWCPAWEWLV
jgi:hypothetical protein